MTNLAFGMVNVHSSLLMQLGTSFFFNCYLAVLRLTLGHYQGASFTNSMLIAAFLHVRPDGHREPCNEVGSLNPAERLAGFEPRNFQF